jgi:outer membrane protein OmpA-like peptidoglycan-associated protein
VRKIFADVDKAKLKSEKTMNPAGQYLQDNPFDLAVVVAVSGLKGDSEDLEVMLQARAMVVRDYLVKNFRMDDKRIKTMTRGKSAAKTDDGTVDVLVYRK